MPITIVTERVLPIMLSLLIINKPTNWLRKFSNYFNPIPTCWNWTIGEANTLSHWVILFLVLFISKKWKKSVLFTRK